MEAEELVLLVDDDPVCQSIVQTSVESLGLAFSGLTSGSGAVDAIRTLQPSLILLDVHLPDISGFDLCTEIQSHAELRAIPILFLTIVDAPEHVEEAFLRGARDYITKPFIPKELQARIRAHIDLFLSIKKLERETNIKQKLFSLISHDLRSPFSSIIGVMQLLLSEYDTMKTADRKDFLQSLLDNSLQQLQLLDNLMYWSRGQSDRIVAQIQPIPLASLVDTVSKELTEMSDKKNVALIIDVSTDLRILGDVDLVRMIIRNMVHNALKFSPSGATVRIYVPQPIPDRGLINLLVEDQGTGIIEGETIFSSLHFISKPGTQGEKGSGIGLKICQALARKQAGFLRILKTDSHGTVLSLCIPRAP